MVGWLDGWMAGVAGAGARRGLARHLCKWALLRSAYAKAAPRRAEDGRTPPKGGFEVFPYWSRRIPACVAVLAEELPGQPWGGCRAQGACGAGKQGRIRLCTATARQDATLPTTKAAVKPGKAW